MRIFQGGGETNVGAGLAYTFGLRTAVLTVVEDHIGANIRNQLRTAGVDQKIIWFNTKNDGGRFSTDQKGTLMNGVNFTYVGKGVIASDTLYYRAHCALCSCAKATLIGMRCSGPKVCASSAPAAFTA